ncbi:MAG: hypothetical protein M1829_000114 [Trizodia sp. TS-e1964]|nr:MAG: hypothetical protein M1829_000114 [Trizodia sp. TS-e1964]
MSQFAHILESPTIRLLVAPDKEFTVHRALLEKHLPDLRIPTRERYLHFEGDQESVSYLLECLYTGNYHAPSIDHSPDSAHAEESVPAVSPHNHHPIVVAARTSALGVWGRPAAVHSKRHEIEPVNSLAPAGKASPPVEAHHPMVLAARTSTLGVWGRPAAVHSKKVTHLPTTPKQETAREASSYFASGSGSRTGLPSPPASPNGKNAQTPAAEAAITTTTVAEPAAVPIPKPTVATVFLIHARIYLLAKHYSLSSLEHLVLEKLHHLLSSTGTTATSGDIASLVKAVYSLPSSSSEKEAKSTSGAPHIRKLVLQHVVSAHSAQNLQADKEFASLLRGGGDLVIDFLGEVAGGKEEVTS